MSTLTDTAVFSKKASVWVVVGIVALVVLLIFLGIGKRIKKAFFPEPPPPPTVAFGKLPKVDLSEGIKPRDGIVYNLETITGDFPQLPTVFKVFGIREAETSFGALEEISGKLANERFESEPLEIMSGVLKFVDSINEDRTITVDLTRRDFLLESGYFTDTRILAGRPISIEDAQNRTDGLFRTLGVDVSDFGRDKIITKFLRIDGTALSSATSLSSANLIQVIYNRNDLDGTPVIWPQQEEPLVYTLVGLDQIVEAKVENMPIEKFRFSSYPLKGPAAAFEQLKKGNAAFNEPLTTSAVTIIDVSIGYVESTKSGQFLQPFYFFRGPGDFIAYVPAVDLKWLKD